MLTIIWQCMIATNLQIVKNALSLDHNKMRYACTLVRSQGVGPRPLQSSEPTMNIQPTTELKQRGESP